MPDDEFIAAFEAGHISPHDFRHADHVRVAWLLLGRHGFAEALWRMSTGLRLITAHAGQPSRYHETITVAFLALIGERRANGPAGDFAAFREANPELFSGNPLGRYYPPAMLNGELARATFILPPATQPAV